MTEKGYKFRAKKDIALTRNKADGFESGFDVESREGGIAATDNTTISEATETEAKSNTPKRLYIWIKDVWKMIFAAVVAGVLLWIFVDFYLKPIEEADVETIESPSDVQRK